MKRKIIFFVVAFVLILAAVLGVLGFRQYQKQFAWIGETCYKKDITELDLSGMALEDPEALRPFTALEKLDLRESGISVQIYEQLHQMLPETEILWDIPFQGACYAMDTQSLTITDLTEQEIELLAYFGELQQIDAAACDDYAMLAALRARYPHLNVNYRIRVGEAFYDYNVTQLVLRDAGLAQLETVLPFFEKLQDISFEGLLPEAEALNAFREGHPELNVYWQVNVLGTMADVHTTELDFTGMQMTSTEELEAAVPYLPSLTKVLMMDCGLSNDHMAQLNEKFPDTLFVWNVRLGRGIVVRSDITVFAPVIWNKKVSEGDLTNLRYCTKVEVIDLGHMKIKDVSFLNYMPEVRFLVLADTLVKDLTPLSGLKKLQFLELFIAPIRDYSPLVGCTALEDLNLSGTYGDPEPLMQMTWLKRLWHVMRYMSSEERAALAEALPNTEIKTPTHGSTGGGWREGPLYFEMRDLMGMPYMEG